MKSDLLHWRPVLAAICGILIATGVAVNRAQADQWDKMTILTVNQPIQVQDKLLEPGQYVFKLLNSSSDRHIVQIYNRDQNHLIDTILAIPNYRIQPTGGSRFTFWETPKGSARALRAWFYPGDNFGHEFTYPKHLAVIETASVTQAPPPPAPTQTEAVAPEPQTQASVQAPEPQQQVEIAQNTPPPAAAPAPEPAPASEPTSLPKTASPFPLIGLSGLLSLGIYSLLRLKRLA
jgi:hypothetical protein